MISVHLILSKLSGSSGPSGSAGLFSLRPIFHNFINPSMERDLSFMALITDAVDRSSKAVISSSYIVDVKQIRNCNTFPMPSFGHAGLTYLQRDWKPNVPFFWAHSMVSFLIPT